MNYISRAYIAFSGGGLGFFFFGLFVFCFSFFNFGLWSGPVPGSQLHRQQLMTFYFMEGLSEAVSRGASGRNRDDPSRTF